MLTHGTDMRLPSRHAEAHADSPFRATDWPLVPALEAEARRNRALLDEVRVPVFASTPGMLDDVPEARWLPVVVDGERWANGTRPMQRERPLVVHAPTSSMLKGSELIEPIVRELHDRGVIEYRRIEGVALGRDVRTVAAMPTSCSTSSARATSGSRMRGAGRGSDRRGACARVGACHRRAQTGSVLPIVEADAASLTRVLVELISHRDHARDAAARGPAFVREVHDGTRSADGDEALPTGRDGDSRG